MPKSADMPLEPDSTEVVYQTPGGEVDGDQSSWWATYSSRTSASLTSTAWTVLTRDCGYIVENAVFGAGDPGGEGWPESRVRRGLVLGSVQSGKTASMIGVTALALDRGVDAVVVLAGSRTSLWRQTFDRICRQLELGVDTATGNRRSVVIPSVEIGTSEDSSVSLSDIYSVSKQRARRAIHVKQPILAVVMKHADHLRTLGDVLRKQVFPELSSTDRPFHLMVLDDEADDGSVLDAVVEASRDPAYGELKQVPRAIADLWDTIPRSGNTAHPSLHVTYVAYTATPQANLLQSDHNPLAPTDFVVALRTPFDVGQLEPRSTVFFEPKGLGNYYTGGETYYRRGEKSGFIQKAGPDAVENVANAVRAYLVAGAIRLLRRPNALGPHSAREEIFATPDEAVNQAPDPHSMLIHVSALTGDQFAVAEDLLMWAGATDRTEARLALASEVTTLPPKLS